MAAPPKKTLGVGALAELYTNSKDSRLVQLRDKGYCVIRGALNTDVVKDFVKKVDKNLESDGFEARFGSSMGRPMLAKDLPSTTFWSIDTVLYPLSNWAIELRFAIREAFAAVANVPPASLASSFDGVIMKDGRYAGPLQRPLSQDEVLRHRIPCGVDKAGAPNGPTHCDQNRYLRRACESLQIFCPLKAGDLATILLAPTAEWTLQDVLDELTAKFPDSYQAPATGKRKRQHNDLHEDGFFFPAEHRDYLLSIGAVEMIRPRLEPGDLLIWSSAIPHCSGQYPSVLKRADRAPRLGIIVGFAPKALLSAAARELRAKVVGAGFATGQQVLRPSKHGSSEARIWRYAKPEAVPAVYHRHRAWRKALATAPLWQAVDSDGPEMVAVRSKLRCLLGL